MIAGRAERARAGVPAEVMQFVTGERQLGEPDHGRVAGRRRVRVDDRDRVRLVRWLCEGRDVCELLRRARGGIARRSVESGVVVMGMMAVVRDAIVGGHVAPSRFIDYSDRLTPHYRF